MKSKKILSLILTIALAVTYCMSIGTVTAGAAGTPTISVSSAEANPGDTVSITVSISNNTGNLGTVGILVKADTGITFIEDSVSGALGAPFTSNFAVEGQCTLVWLNMSEALPSGDGVIATLKCKVSDTATGDLNVTVTPSDGGLIDYTTEKTIDSESKGGTITVTCKEHTWGDWIIDSAATCEEAGKRHRECKVCGTKEEEGIKQLAHNMTAHVAAKSASCTEAGNPEYWTCSICKKNYADKDGKTLLSDEDLVIPAKGHTLVPHAKEEATCEKEGTEAYWECSECKKLFSDAEGTTKIDAVKKIEKADHTLKHIVAKEPTSCAEEGNMEYWECEVCGKYFSDEAGTTEIADKDSVKETIAHKLTAHEKVEADCKAGTDGTEAYWQCDKCGKYFSDADGKTEIDAPVTIKAAHKWSAWKVTKAATATEDGTQERECSVCGLR